MNNTEHKSNWGGKRQCAGRKKSCQRKVPFNRRINENILNILRAYAHRHNLTETQALESAILLQSNIDCRKGEPIMKIAIPTTNKHLCPHFGKCETFTFADVDTENKTILSMEEKAPAEGISCQNAGWVSEQGANLVLAGGMGGRPLETLTQNGVEIIVGCPSIEVKELITQFLNETLELQANTCSGHHENGEHHCHCHGESHGEHHCHCHGESHGEHHCHCHDK